MEKKEPEIEKKPEVEDDYVQVKVVDHNGSSTSFKIKKTTPMRKLKNAFCERKGIQSSSVRFFVNGQRVNDDVTAKQLELENDDTIEVFKEQQGGYKID